MRKMLLALLACALLAGACEAEVKTVWKTASTAELQALLPARAPVEKERIETEMRTASGIVGPRGKMIAGVVLITAGYSADGKYSHYLVLQNAMQVGDVALPAGTYVFGWTRIQNGLLVHLYDALTGVERGSSVAQQMTSTTRVEAFRIWPPSERSILQIGRFMLPYKLKE